METITKRLHISGLTPQITSADLASRFSSFGTVKALDGLGKLDANGMPRPFAYLTIESTKSQVAKCVNLLSGTTWKGAKLRVGDAKPDYKERIEQEHAKLKRSTEDSENSGPPRKRKRLTRGCHGVHASDMSLVTVDNVSSRHGWHKTPMGRLVRPIRIRPNHPLPEPSQQLLEKVKGKSGKCMKVLRARKQRKKAGVLVRARRRTIDPLRWGSQYLKGILLEADGVVSVGGDTQYAVEGESGEDGSDDDETPAKVIPSSRDHAGQSAESARGSSLSSPTIERTKPPPLPVKHPLITASASLELSDDPPADTDVAGEAAAALSLLGSLFGEQGDGEWGGEESLSDIDMDAARTSEAAGQVSLEYEDDFEIVPGPMKKGLSMVPSRIEVPTKTRESDTNPNEHPKAGYQPHAEPSNKVHMKKLKDLFAPHAEEASFSLLGNLDVDLELDDTLVVPSGSTESTSQRMHSIQSHPTSHPPSIIPSSTSLHQMHLDPSKPLFFPLLLSPTSRASKSRPKDIFDVLAARASYSDDVFGRTQTSEEIEKNWREKKGELTRTWKRRHREAVKSARRRGGLKE